MKPIELSKTLKLIIILFTMFLSNCSHDAKIYEKNNPKIDIRDFFNGNLEAFGIVRDRSNKVIKTFKAKIKGSWQGNIGTLEEHFEFSDNKKDHRVWTIKMIDDHNFSATAHDVVGIAHGKQYGNAVKMQYILTIAVDDKKYDIKIDDWMYLIDNKSLINVSDMKKFGFKVGSLAIGFNKLD
ncbi:MAG: hypothetical protein CMP18_02420 [Rickettsiales bacterium]|jgi:hypothetical protein|nr:hypothetical protein [Rickettsiales bacterium]MDA9573588.1 DUF3833 domain-containing protein [Rickettsiales bacterium]|tara:strand:- start:10254 stop:10799 length:546 start_codon:yes stop_codon:yes gene_type:complete